MKRLLTLIAFYSLSAYAWGPGVDNDLIGTQTQFSSNFFLQTISATGHFGVSSDRANSYFLMQERPELKSSALQKDRAQAIAHEQSDLSWFLGYAFYQSSAFVPSLNAQVNDAAHSFKIGMDWELVQRANIIASGGYELIPAENYSQGFFQLALTYTIPLTDECPFDESPVDAEQYYINKNKYEECPKHGAKDRYPNLELGVVGSYELHTKSPTTSGRLAGSTLPGDQQLNEAASGPQLGLNVNQFLDFKAKLLFYIYDNPPAPFLQNTTIGGFRPKANLAVADLQDTTPILLVFPKRSVDVSMGIHWGQGFRLLSEMSYSTWDASSTVAAVGQVSTTFSVGGVLDFAFAQRWKADGTMDLTSGNGYRAFTGGVGISYAL